MRKRPTAIFVLAAVLALASGCGQAKAGTALPKGDDAADYVGGKFEQVIGKLEDSITDTRDVTNSLDAYFKFDDKWIHSTVTSARTGSPESRAVRHRSQKNPDEIIDTYTPADGTVEFTYLGPVYVQKGVSPTAWVSMPKPETGLIQPCVWGGVLTPCRMADSTVDAYKADKRAVRGAKSLGDGKTALTVNVPFEVFVKNKVEIRPSSPATATSSSSSTSSSSPARRASRTCRSCPTRRRSRSCPTGRRWTTSTAGSAKRRATEA
jgi:hypothetical protein